MKQVITFFLILQKMGKGNINCLKNTKRSEIGKVNGKEDEINENRRRIGAGK